jgi:hypothetical protein
MARKKDRGRAGLQGQKWLNTRLSEDVNSLTATVTALELDALSLPTRSEGFDIANDEDSSGEEHVADAETSTPNSSSSNVTETDEEFESEEAAVNVSTTVAQQVQMHFGINNTEVSDDNDNDDNNSNYESNVKLSPTTVTLFQTQSRHHQASETRYLSKNPEGTDFLADAYYLSS